MKAHISITLDMDASHGCDKPLEVMSEISVAVNKFLYSWNRGELLKKLKGIDYGGGSTKNLCIAIAMDKQAFIYNSTGTA